MIGRHLLMAHRLRHCSAATDKDDRHTDRFQYNFRPDNEYDSNNEQKPHHILGH